MHFFHPHPLLVWITPVSSQPLHSLIHSTHPPSLTANMADAVGGAPKVNGHANGYPSAYAAKYELAAHFIGGNELSRAPPSKVKDFVAAHDGHTVITSVSFASFRRIGCLGVIGKQS